MIAVKELYTSRKVNMSAEWTERRIIMSLYWDDFDRRINETVTAIKHNENPTIRRVSVFITNKCNLSCSYCRHNINQEEMSKSIFQSVVDKYGKDAIIHITGGEPSTIKWLYPYISEHGDKYRFHLNTNGLIKPPYKYLKRLKISLDSHDANYWDLLVGHRGAFNIVVNNIKEAIPHTTVSITYTLTKQNYMKSVDFASFVNKEFHGLYAVFFSIYKGTDERYALSKEDGDEFFYHVLPRLNGVLSTESRSLLSATIDEKMRLIQGTRFPENAIPTCYLSLSERVISPSGKEYGCSHLYRDGILGNIGEKHKECLYGCNRRLVKFNQDVQLLLTNCPQIS